MANIFELERRATIIGYGSEMGMVVKHLGEEGHKNKPVQSVEQFQLRTPLDKSKSVALCL